MRLLVLAACTAVAAAAPFKHAVRALAKNGTAHVLAGAQPHWQTYNIKFILLDGSCQILHAGMGQVNRRALDRVFVTGHPESIGEDDLGDSAGEYITIYAPTPEEAWARGGSLCPKGIDNSTMLAEPARVLALKQRDEIETRPIRQAGDSSNRIDVVLMGDGYTEEQREKMFDDMTRLVDDMWGDITFQSYLPVFNIWALFKASSESGIGVGGVPRDTSYGLYRDGTQLRGIFTSRAQVARDTCALAPGCDFPSLIGNDLYYGGLGGEFTISTSSDTSGTVVLRHEMGHNFINVGEEYDDGSVYRGANNSPTLSNTGWEAWLNVTDEPLREEAAVKRLGEYPWHDLAAGARAFTFTSNGEYKRWFLRFTASGCEVDDALRVRLDGVELEWKSSGTLDRSFYSYYDFDTGFSAGDHVLEFAMGSPPAAGAPIRQLASLTLHEYMGEDLFHFDNHYVGAYPTWSVRDVKSYRPSNERCLMRNMTSSHFCAPCKEEMWLQFFARMSAIDNVTIDYDWNSEPPLAAATLNTVKLGQLREGAPVQDVVDRLLVRWTHNTEPVPNLDDQFVWSAPIDDVDGDWDVQVVYQTNEVRSDPNDLLTFDYSFTVGEIPPQHHSSTEL